MIKLTRPPYKGANGAWMTEALFYDLTSTKASQKLTYEPLFTLYEDRPGLINCRKTFVGLRDPTGYKWALTYLGDWNHWLRLMRCTWFREAYEVWIAELNTLLQSEAVAKVREIMDGENAGQALAAAKFMATKEYDKNKRGRPSKEELQGKLKQAAEAMSREDEDLARIGLTVIDGGKVAN